MDLVKGDNLGDDCSVRQLTRDYQRDAKVMAEIEERVGMRERALVRSLVDVDSGATAVRPETLVYFYRECLARDWRDGADRIACLIRDCARPILSGAAALLPVQWRIDAGNDALGEMFRGLSCMDGSHEFWEINFRGTLKRRLFDVKRVYEGSGRDGSTGTHGDDGQAERVIDSCAVAESPDARVIIEMMLDLIPPPYQEPFKWVKLDGLTLEEAGARLKCSSRTVTNHINRARAILRKAIG